MSIGTQTQTNAGENMAGKPFEPINPGNYVVALDRVMDKTSPKTGSKYLDLSFRVTEGEQKGRLIFGTRFFYEGVSPKAVEISNEKAGKLLNAMGVNGGLDALGNDLHALGDFIGKEIVGKIDVEYPVGYKARNIIKSFQKR